ncbi:MAG: fibronectin type III domain-containing protein [Acidobacteriota bacterium]|nr:fibronectin type III domain-containing protein [Acidobacteriota bacterium]
MKDRTAAISWGASSGATEYVVEVGSTTGGIDGGVHSAGTATSFTLRDLRAGRSHVRIKARNASGTSGASSEATFVLPDLADYIEAIFLASGPLVYSPSPGCGNHGRWSAFPRGTTVRNLVSPQIPSQYREAIRVVLDQVAQATDGRLAATFEVVADAPHTVGVNEMVHVALQTAGEIQFACGSISGVACVTHNSPVERGAPFSGGLIRWAVGYYVVPNTPTTRPYAHEPGHGVLGMCHINADAIGGRQHSLMSVGDTPAPTAATSQSERLSPFDIEALQTVYGSSVAIGARRPEFVAAGLVK